MGYFRKGLQTALAALLSALLTAGCAASASLAGKSADAPVSRTGFYFDTVIQLSIYGMARDEADVLLDGCMAMAERFDGQLFSAHNGRSQLWCVNHAEQTRAAGGEPEKVDPEVASLLQTALDWSARTDGAFLPTMGALSDLWNFGGDPPGPVPSAAAIDEARTHIAPDAVRIETAGDTARIFIDVPGLRIDLGGIAKGYAADRLKAYLVENGVTSAVLNLGGNVLLIGSRPDGSDFRIGIQDPGTDAALGETLLTVPVSDRSVVTSGVYERYFEEDGVRYHHVLDPATGYPADTGLISVTILSDDSTTGDALATACLVLGQEKGQALIESLPGVEALFVSSDGTLSRTGGFPH